MAEQMDAVDSQQQKEIEDLKHKDEIHDLLLQIYKEHNNMLRNLVYAGIVVLALLVTVNAMLFMYVFPLKNQ